MTDLREIPGIGPRIEQALIELGHDSIASLRNENAEELYERDCIRRGCRLDRCLLYVYRLAVYYANTSKPDPEKLVWWYWKDY